MAVRGPLARALAAAAVTVALVPVPATASAAGLKAIWGPGDASAFSVYEELGVDVVQQQLTWASVAPARPTAPANPLDPAYRWPSALDTAVTEASLHDMEVALLVKGTPTWAVSDAAPGSDVRTQAPSNPADFANFLRAANARYPGVRRWMIWGEANRTAVWSSGPVAYAELLDAAYGALKPLPGDPDVVIGGMTFTFGETAPRDWIAGMVRSNSTRPRLDEYGHNPFARRCPDLSWGPDHLRDGARDISDIDTLIAETRAAFGSHTKLWLSEFTVSSDRANRAMTFFVSRDEQADWVRKAFATAGSVDYVSGLGWFGLYDEPATKPMGLTTGLMTYEGEQKPAYAAYRDARLDGSMPLVPCPRPPAPAPATPPAAPAGPAPPADPPAPPRDGAAPGLRLKAKPAISFVALVKRGYPVAAACSEACRIRAVLLLGRRPVGSARGSLAEAGTSKLKVRLTKKGTKAIRRARGAKLTLRVTATDAAGNATRREVKLRPRG